MINTSKFLHQLQIGGINFFTGVPDSLLSSLCACIDDRIKKSDHIITPNEGNAIALAAGYYLGTGKYGAVYMQNSGLGNAINPLTSLADSKVYSIPMLLIIGWRGEPDEKDEPQHIKQGEITPSQLELLNIPYQILDSEKDFSLILKNSFRKIKETNAPVALLIRKNTFSEYKSNLSEKNLSELSREESLRTILDLIGNDVVISTTGKTSREVFEIRAESNRSNNQHDFLTVGSMGYASSIALGVALTNPKKRIICLDGDGSMLMHMGSLSMIGTQKPTNFVHILINNSAHESVGGQRTVADQLDFSLISRSCGYTYYAKADSITSIKSAWKQISNNSGPCMLEIMVRIGSRDNLGRPTTSPEENKKAFMEFLQST